MCFHSALTSSKKEVLTMTTYTDRSNAERELSYKLLCNLKSIKTTRSARIHDFVDACFDYPDEVRKCTISHINLYYSPKYKLCINADTHIESKESFLTHFADVVAHKMYMYKIPSNEQINTLLNAY